MKRGQVIALVGIVLLAAAWVLAAPDFSGTWMLDSSKSDPIAMGRGGGAPAEVKMTMEIKQTAEGMTVTQTMEMGGNQRTSDQTFTFDGKENINPAPMGRGQLTSKSHWEGEQLVIEGTQKMSTQKGDFEISTKEVYALSADGKVLTITATRSTPQGDRTTKRVFNKQ